MRDLHKQKHLDEKSHQLHQLRPLDRGGQVARLARYTTVLMFDVDTPFAFLLFGRAKQSIYHT